MTPTPVEVLLTGGGGQLGTEIRRLAPKGTTIVAPGRTELDLGDPSSIAAMIASRPWAAVVNAGAYTAVDRAESDIVDAWKVNALGPAALAQATAAAGVPIVQISTDYVFDGAKLAPYQEDDPVAPLGVYGASKLAGELAVRTGNPRHLILRTAWVVSPHGSNFVKTMLRLAETRPELGVVDDQRGCPTGAADIARAVLQIADRMARSPDAPTGVYHFVNAGEATWCEFARAIFAGADARGRPTAKVNAISTADYPTPAKRPANSRLAVDKLRRDFGIDPRPWPAALDEILATLLDAERKQED